MMADDAPKLNPTALPLANAAWPRPGPTGLTGYEAHKERSAQRNREMALLGRDIATGERVHPPRNAERRERSERDFRFFCEAYFPQTFLLPWSPDHLKVIAKIEQAVLEGGLFAMAMPRGSGKTSGPSEQPRAVVSSLSHGVLLSLGG